MAGKKIDSTTMAYYVRRSVWKRKTKTTGFSQDSDFGTRKQKSKTRQKSNFHYLRKVGTCSTKQATRDDNHYFIYLLC